MQWEALVSVVFSALLLIALKSDCLEIGLNGKHSTLFVEVSGVLQIVIEKPNACFILSPGRAHIRIRSPRFVASSFGTKWVREVGTLDP